VNYLFEHFKRYRKDLFIGVTVGLVVGFVALITGLGLQPAMVSHPKTLSSIADSAPMPELPITDQSSVEDILTLMKNSHNLWKTLNADVLTVWQPAREPQTVYTNIQIEQISKARLTIQQYNNDNKQMFDVLWVSDGEKAYEQDNLSKRYTEYTLPTFAQSVDDFGLQSNSSLGDSVIIRHPMAVLIPSPIADYLYPTGLMQRQGKLEVLGTDKVSSREAVVIAWVGFDEKGLLTGKATFWVDSYTGVILKALVYGGETWDDVAEETTIVSIVFDKEIEAEVFAFKSSPDFEYLPLEKFYNH